MWAQKLTCFCTSIFHIDTLQCLHRFNGLISGVASNVMGSCNLGTSGQSEQGSLFRIALNTDRCGCLPVAVQAVLTNVLTNPRTCKESLLISLFRFLELGLLLANPTPVNEQKNVRQKTKASCHYRMTDGLLRLPYPRIKLALRLACSGYVLLSWSATFAAAIGLKGSERVSLHLTGAVAAVESDEVGFDQIFVDKAGSQVYEHNRMSDNPRKFVKFEMDLRRLCASSSMCLI
ncbi:uncharacterized protein BDR25DRAFT_352090 [Lindgomyces ingoldianus]|uniref:Uncharacterized protein n=1 Tax=Lindgomyces ingoldianus TaxID=673940 RepID=A0ACB6R2T8_9PLEO|nr:uncharacterized protein BDR25DRAFT_352090 [Lindgomyces ingoldianus]KAF2473598.1 hypothetical protein BDR25DRAFT_352090 [Lindgomyces ingoldianus]